MWARLQVSRVAAASVEVEVVICEEHPRQVVVGTAVCLTLTTDRQTDRRERAVATETKRRKERKAFLTATAERKWYELWRRRDTWRGHWWSPCKSRR